MRPLLRHNEIIGVIRINKMNNDIENTKKGLLTKSIRETFKGALPKRIALEYTSYTVKKIYTFPILKWFRYLRYGHGVMTCKNKIRCNICSDYNHDYKHSQDNPYCFFCNENCLQNTQKSTTDKHTEQPTTLT